MMEKLRHVETLESAALYAAPDHARVYPRQIPDGREVIEILTGGEVFFNFDGEERRFTRGTIFWHVARDFTICKTSTDAPYRCAVLTFQVTARCRVAPRVLEWTGGVKLEAFIEECIALFHAHPEAHEELGAFVYGMLLRQAACRSVRSGLILPTPLVRALSLLEQSPGQGADVQSLAARAGVSRARIFALFRQYLGNTPHGYWRQLAMARARALLAGSTMPIKDIVLECGFGGVEVFYRSFRAVNAMTPKQYRERNQPYRNGVEICR